METSAPRRHTFHQTLEHIVKHAGVNRRGSCPHVYFKHEIYFLNVYYDGGKLYL